MSGGGFLTPYYKAMARPASLALVCREARACRLCERHLPLGPKPVFLAGRAARLLVVGQAPGRRVHESGIPWNDASGDQPRAECAPLWQPRFRAALPGVRLTLLVGSYAQAYWLGGRRKRTLAGTVRSFRDYAPQFFPLPHPSWRNRAWMKRNPWFEREVIPALRRRVERALRSRR